MEVKKNDGSEYPPGTLKSMIFAIGYYYQHVLEKKRHLFIDEEFMKKVDLVCYIL